MSVPGPLIEKLGGLQKGAALVGGLALSACIMGVFTDPDQFFRSYLVGYLLWIGVALGSLALLMIQHLITGEWGWIGRRSLEAATRTLWLLALAFLPILFGMGHLYEWAIPEHVAGDLLLEHKAPYLNARFFWMRTAVYFAVWLFLAVQLNRWSREQDRGEKTNARRFQLTSGLGLLLFGLTASFASVDWVMSLEPHWFSTIYGLQFIAGVVLSSIAFMVPVLLLLAAYDPLKDRIKPSHFHDYGNLMLAFVLLWAYLAFSQYLITWSGNLPEEIPWYINRTQGGWQWLGVILVVFHFAVPFALLLSRVTKRSGSMLSKVALTILIMRWVDLIWLVEPAFNPQVSIHWMDVAAPMGIGGAWLATFIWQLKAMPLVPLADPRFIESPEIAEAVEHGTS